MHPYLVATHPCRICEKEKGADGKGWVQNIHPGATENLFPDDYAKGYSHRKHPKRSIYRYDQRDKHACYQVSFFHFVAFDNGKNKFNQQAYAVGNYHQWQYFRYSD